MTESTQLTDEGVLMPADGPRHRMLETDRCTRWLGAEVLQADPGHARLRMTVRREMTNGFDIVHGGMLFTLADTCFAMACNHPEGDDATVTVASGADINFLKTAWLGDELVAEAVEISRSGRSGIYDVTITRADETIAVFRGRSRTIASPEKK
ncbi:hydroxyphenylacetyl-CoA thioesterase PaaI [Nesterenkonia sp. HG001]|uniref:hydroxyphenylacetyl-CoA thioesterase PaaI n=1 Tax=Nesterenkonia sp. HG001 TaxID=2983207 RepID=UPI002AC61013|nr:hydroxyphenylacetyl-CoA thioesterase PaaI [Nesterenkonia sp. HG001]MDZ5076369.1 hydroxyphenylacetyl-CoA thioesterase PaaI [Nesterenkonia sp. HG001]